MKQKSAYFLVERREGDLELFQVQSQLEQMKGVCCANINPSRKLVAVDYNSSQLSLGNIQQQLHALGYEMIPHSHVTEKRF